MTKSKAFKIPKIVLFSTALFLVYRHYVPHHHRKSLMTPYATVVIYVQERIVFAEKADSSEPNSVISESLNASTKMLTPSQLYLSFDANANAVACLLNFCRQLQVRSHLYLSFELIASDVARLLKFQVPSLVYLSFVPSHVYLSFCLAQLN